MANNRTAIVTGSLGTVGRWVLGHLAERGWDVVGVDLSIPEFVDRTAPAGGESAASFRAADLTDHGEALELIEDLDPTAVVHLAAVPGVGIHSDARTFETNVTSTYNVLTAAGRVGARVVWTSSNATYGTVFAEEPWLPDYLPMDEDHPFRPEDPYGTSKVAGEAVAAMTARQFGVPVVSLRPPLVQVPGAYQTARVRESFDPDDPTIDGSFWSYIDVRDVATAVRQALEVDLRGHEPILIAAADNYLDRPTEEVLRAGFGRLPERCALQGDESVYSRTKAGQVLDWEPAHSWREAETADVSPPAPFPG